MQAPLQPESIGFEGHKVPSSLGCQLLALSSFLRSHVLKCTPVGSRKAWGHISCIQRCSFRAALWRCSSKQHCTRSPLVVSPAGIAQQLFFFFSFCLLTHYIKFHFLYSPSLFCSLNCLFLFTVMRLLGWHSWICADSWNVPTSNTAHARSG